MSVACRRARREANYHGAPRHRAEGRWRHARIRVRVYPLILFGTVRELQIQLRATVAAVEHEHKQRKLAPRARTQSSRHAEI